VDTLEQYFGFEIDNFAMIDFEGMKAVINALGGVDLYITVEEAAFMLIQMDEDQMVHLDGRLALRHARDRSSGGNNPGSGGIPYRCRTVAQASHPAVRLGRAHTDIPLYPADALSGNIQSDTRLWLLRRGDTPHQLADFLQESGFAAVRNNHFHRP
jgi:hypothetical protein